MKKIITKTDIKWLNPESTMTLYESTNFNDINIKYVTSVFGFIIKEKKIVVINNIKPNRGLEIPGGHIEQNETPEEALKRELMEEACIKVRDINLIAVHEINNPIKDNKYPYPRGYQAFYIAHVHSSKTFKESEEIKSRQFLTKNDFLKLEWAIKNKELVEIFLKQANL